MNLYDVGDVVRVSGTFTNSAGTVVDPSSVTFQYNRKEADPSSATMLVFGVNSIAKPSTGVYYTDLNVSSGGQWNYRWNGLGANAAAVEGSFNVRWKSFL